MQFTVYFDSPFWIGVLEVERNGVLYAARHVFGAEPSDQQLYAFVLHDLLALLATLDTGVSVAHSAAKARNPKRVQREIQRELQSQGVRSKAHEALRRQYEQHKLERQDTTRAEREAARELQRQRKLAKAHARHRGH